MAAKYKIKTWKLYQIKQFYDEGKLVLPSYQRSLKWDENRKKNLIETMREGNPIGTFLLYQDDAKRFQIVDGLQRISTIIGYMNNTEKYIDKEILDFEVVEKLIRISCTIDSIVYIPEQLESQILFLKEQIVAKYKELGNNKANFNIEILKLIGAELENSHYYTEGIAEVINQIEDRVNLTDIEIPLIIYLADRRDLPRIFTDINQNSLILTEYEIYAAQWSNINVGEVDPILLEKLKNKYDKINNDPDSGFDIDYDRDLNSDKTLSLYEFCFALGEMISDSSKGHTNLFIARKNSGFELLSLILTDEYNYSEILEFLLGSESLGYSNGNKNLAKELYKSVLDILRHMMFIDEYVMINGKSYIYSYFQIFHIFMSLFKKKYIITHKATLSNGDKIESNDFNEIYSKTRYYSTKSQLSIIEINTSIGLKTGFGPELKKFKQYVIPVMLKQTFDNFWVTNRQVTHLTKQIKNNSNIYFEDISENDFVSSAVGSLRTQVTDSQFSVIKFPSNVKLSAVIIHNILLKISDKYKVNCGDYKNYEFDHIIPKSILKELRLKVPIASLMNCWVLDKKSNIRKNGFSISELANTPFTMLDHDFMAILGITEYQFKVFAHIKDLSTDAKKVEFQKYIEDRIKVLPNHYYSLKQKFITYMSRSN
jgi:uncharacterized protein with ParB-like and HNH nuclease domain